MTPLPIDVTQLPDGKLLHLFPEDNDWENWTYTITSPDCEIEYEIIEKPKRYLHEFV